MLPTTRLEILSLCEHVRYGISKIQTYHDNYLRRLSMIQGAEPPALRIVLENMEYIAMVLKRVEQLLCNGYANTFTAYNELDKLYTRIISNQYIPGAVRATIYEIYYELKKLLYGSNEQL